MGAEVLAFEIFAWMSASVCVWAMIEWTVHRWPMHSRAWQRLSPQTWWEHARVHHTYFKVFDHEPAPAARYTSMSVDWVYNALGSAWFWLPFGWFVSGTGAACFVAVGVLHGILWTAAHREMHYPAGRWFAKTMWFQAIRAHHWTHHIHPGSNFGALFGGLVDTLMGTCGSIRLADRSGEPQAGIPELKSAEDGNLCAGLTAKGL